MSLTNNLKGMLYISIGFFVWSIVDTIQKILTDDFHPIQIVWFRCIGLFIVMLLYKFFNKNSLIKTENKLLHFIRGILIVLSSLCFVTSISFVPLADAISATFVAPFFVTIIGFFFLKEKVGIKRFLAILFGFFGTIIIIRPGLGIIHPAILFAVIAALLFAIRQVISRYLSLKDNVSTILFYTSFSASLVTTLPLALFWKNPTTYSSVILLFVLSILASIAEYFLIKALEKTESIILAPIHYTLILWGTMWGYFVFGDFPDFITFIGTTIIVLAGIYTIRREYMIKQIKLK